MEINESRVKILTRADFEQFGAIVFGALIMGDGDIKETQIYIEERETGKAILTT